MSNVIFNIKPQAPEQSCVSALYKYIKIYNLPLKGNVNLILTLSRK